MTNQNKSAQARQRRRSSDGRFADEDKQDSLPSDTKIQQVASLLTDDTEPDFNQLLTATGAFDDPYEARHIEFDMPRRIHHQRLRIGRGANRPQQGAGRLARLLRNGKRQRRRRGNHPVHRP